MPAPVIARWQLRTSASLAQTWELLSDTDRINRVADMEVSYLEQVQQDGTVKRMGASSRLGMSLRWTEPPFEWCVPQRYAIRRTFSTGPAESYDLRCDLTEDDRGTAIDYCVEVKPRSAWSRPLVVAELAAFTKPALERTLLRAVAVLDGAIAAFSAPPPPLSAVAKAKATTALASVESPVLRDALAQLLDEEALVDQRDLQPLRLARRWNQPQGFVIQAFLQAVRGGALTLRWSLRCPSCRVGKAELPSLSTAAQSVHCDSCNISFDGSLPDAMIAQFQPDPSIRELDEAMRCIGSPARTAHVRGSVMVQAGAQCDVRLRLLPGSYRIRTLPDAGAASLQVRADRDTRVVAIDLDGHGIEPPLLRCAPGEVQLSLRSRRDVHCQVLIERLGDEPDVLTVGRLLEFPEAADLVPSEMLQSGLSVESSAGVVLVARVGRGGASASAAVAKALTAYEPVVLTDRGNVVIAAFRTADQAIEAASLLDGAVHVGAGLAAGSILYLHEADTSLAVGMAVERALGLAHGGGELRVDGDDAERVPLVTSLAREGIVASVEVGRSRLQIGPPIRSTPPLRDRPLPPPPSSGDVLGRRFCIRDVLGSGGFGSVYVADDLVAGSDAVVKLLHPALAENLSHLQRFYNEGRLAARVVSAKVARVLDYGIDADGHVWMASERLVGDELAKVLREQGSVDCWTAVAIAAETAAALVDVHAAGLVHRDIKPGNILVAGLDAARPSARLIDFGIAMAQGEALAVLRDTNAVVGTPQYMAPEQAAGRPVDGRCDLFALGVVLFESLSGKLPYSGRTTIEMLLARLQRPALTLAEVGATDVPPFVVAIVASLLAQEPDDRIATAQGAAVALESALAAMGPRAPWSRAWVEQQSGRSTRPESGGVDVTAATIADTDQDD